MSRPVRLLFTVPFGERLGGAENVLHTFLRHVDPDVIVPSVAFHADGAFVEEVAALGWRTHVVPTGRFRQAHHATAAVAGLARIMRRDRIDLAAHWLNRAQVYGSPAAVLAGLRDRTMWFQRHLPDGSDPLDRVATRLPATAIGTPSSAAAQAQQRLLRPSRPTFYVHNGIDLPEHRGAAWADQQRAALGLPPGRPVATLVGRLQRWKGQHRFLRAVALLRDEGTAVHALLVGGTQYGVEPEYADELHALVRDLDIGDRVTFAGQLPGGGQLFELSDVAVSASDEESFGLVLLEAMALGAPLVAVDHGGPGEILEHGRTGWLVPRATPEDLAGGLRALLHDDHLRAGIASAAQQRVHAHHTAPVMTRALERRLVALAAPR